MKNENAEPKLRRLFSALIVTGLLVPVAMGFAVWKIIGSVEAGPSSGEPSSGLETSSITIHEHPISVELAQTPQEWETGLSYRDSMPMDHGMLFLFPTADQQTFWMNGMRFPLDIIFLEQGAVIQIEENLPAQNGLPPRIVISHGQADAVLELNAGIAASLGLSVGDVLELPKAASAPDTLPVSP